MNKRRAARELAVIAFSHIIKSLKKAEEPNITEIIQRSGEALLLEAEDNLSSAARELLKVRDFVQEYELEHPANLERPFDVGTLPVNIPLTSDMLGRMDMALDAVSRAGFAAELLRLLALAELDEVKDYAIRIIRAFNEQKDEVDRQIKEHSEGWDVERLIKIDRDILRIAVTEIICFDDVPKSVSIDEAVELAKKYSSDEAAKFINGILGQIGN